MERVYKFTQLPEGYATLAQAAWLTLNDLELYEVNGRLVFTEDIDVVLGKSEAKVVTYEFLNHASFEKWLLEAVAEWCLKPEDGMLQEMGDRISLG